MKDFQRCFFAPRYQTRGLFVRSTGHYIIRSCEAKNIANFSEIFWCIGGSGLFRLNGREYLLRPEQLFYYPPGSCHDIVPQNPCFNYRWLSIEGKFCGAFFEALGFAPGVMHAGKCPDEVFAKIELHLQNIIQDSQLKALNAAVEVLTCAITPKKEEHSLLDQIKRFIDDNYWQLDLNVSELAKYFKLHRITLCHLFQRQYGIAPSQYLASIRIQKGIEMLPSTDCTIKQIAEKCGFNSADYFSKKIKQHTGMIPQQLQMKQNSKSE